MRAQKRRSLTEKLKQENEELRSAARQLLEGLSQYAKEANWRIEGTMFRDLDNDDSQQRKLWAWIGEGDGPAVARKFLGLDQQEDKN